MLLPESDEEILHPQQVGLGRLQLQFGLMPARLQAADARRLLEQTAPIGRLGVHDRADPALTDDRRAVRARSGIGEQDLDVARPHFPAVHPEHRSGAAADPPRQLQLVVVAQLRQGQRRAAQMQLHLRQVERRPGDGAGEDHGVHLVAAQAARRCLAHHPAQGIDQIGFAAAIGAHDAGQPRLDQQLGRMPERLEAGEAELGDLHRLRA